MYVEVIITLCLYYMRSYYPNLGQNKLSADEIHANRQVSAKIQEVKTDPRDFPKKVCCIEFNNQILNSVTTIC